MVFHLEKLSKMKKIVMFNTKLPEGYILNKLCKDMSLE